MSRGQEIAGSTSASDALRDWQAVRGDASIQFAPLPPWKPPPPPKPPEWMKVIGEWLSTLGSWLKTIFEPLGSIVGLSWPTIQIVLIVLGSLAAAFILWRIAVPLLALRRKPAPPAEAEWSPDRAVALALLDDADRLAAEGKFDEATHLLLQRSVQHIAGSRPEWVPPASTAREIALLPSLPQRARSAFATIAERVERSRYALRTLNAGDWGEARAAYADFALQKIEAAA